MGACVRACVHTDVILKFLFVFFVYNGDWRAVEDRYKDPAQGAQRPSATLHAHVCHYFVMKT